MSPFRGGRFTSLDEKGRHPFGDSPPWVSITVGVVMIALALALVYFGGPPP